MTLLLALDIATTTGFALGYAEDKAPLCGSIRFGTSDSDDSAVFASALRWAMERFYRSPLPDVLLIEAMLSPILSKPGRHAPTLWPMSSKVGSTTGAVRDRLAGLHGIMRGTARHFGVPEIRTVPVSVVRQHFIGDRSAKRAAAKAATLAMCRHLGWEVGDDNAADAAALWSYGRSLIVPEAALDLMPLFNRMW